MFGLTFVFFLATGVQIQNKNEHKNSDAIHNFAQIERFLNLIVLKFYCLSWILFRVECSKVDISSTALA